MTVCVWAFVAWRVIKCKWCRVKLTQAARWTKLAVHSKTIWHVTSHMMHFQLCLFKCRPLLYPYSPNSKLCFVMMSLKNISSLPWPSSQRCPWETLEHTRLSQPPNPSKTSLSTKHSFSKIVCGWLENALNVWGSSVCQISENFLLMSSAHSTKSTIFE